MAITHVVYNKAKLRQLNQASPVDYDGDTLVLLLCTNSYVPNIDTHEFASDITNELAATGNYVRKTLSGKVVAIDTTGDFAYLDADDVTWNALTPSTAFRYAILFKNTGADATSPLISYINFGVDNSATGDFTLVWPTAATGGVVKLA